MRPRLKLNLYAPHPEQEKFHFSKKRFRVVAFGRQSGKSTMLNNELLDHAWRKPGTEYGFGSPIFSQAREQYRRMLVNIPDGILERKSDTELRIDLINKSNIEFLSGDNPDSWRGKTKDGFVLDEMRDHSPNTFSQIIRPMLATTGGWAAFASTPNGYDPFYDLFEKFRTDPDWESFQAPSTCNPLFTKEEFEAAKREMSEEIFAQEILAEFRDISSGMAYQYTDSRNLLLTSPFAVKGDTFSPHVPIYLGPDFNLDPMAWPMLQIRGRQAHVFDEIWIRNSDTKEAAVAFCQKVLRYNPCSGPQVIVCGDASGKAGQRAAEGRSDYDILFNEMRKHGIIYRDDTPDSNPRIEDRLNAVNYALNPIDGAPFLTFGPNAPKTINDMKRCKRKPVGDSFKIDPGPERLLGHAADGVGYVINEFLPVKSVKAVGQLHIARHIF